MAVPHKKTPGKKSGKIAKGGSTAVFEALLKRTGGNQRYRLRLYITGTSVRSVEAVANIRSVCEDLLPGHYELEVIDIYQQPNEAVSEQIIAAPTLVRQLPMPPKRMIGNLSDRTKVIVGLDLKIRNSRTRETAGKTQWVKV